MGWAEPRLAVHPLEVSHVTAEQQEQLRAQLDVMLARLKGVRVAGSARLEDVLQASAASRCDVRDSCLRFLAEGTDSLYGMYMRVEPTSDEVVAIARVVRSDGVTVRRVTVPVKPHGGLTVVELARKAMASALLELRLAELPSTLLIEPPAAEPFAVLTPPPTPPAAVVPLAEPERRSVPLKTVTGWSLVGVGGATLVAGGVFAALAAAGTAANPPDASGRVAPERAGAVAAALNQSQLSSILIPTGAAVAIIGAVVVLLPRAGPVTAAAAPLRDGLSVGLWGAFP